VLVALAGSNTEHFREQLRAQLTTDGFGGGVTIDSDLLAAYFSGTYQPAGYALIAGTGAVAARIAAGRLEHVVGGNGWLLGDAGSGFWIGHQIVRAVVAALDGRGPQTELTRMLVDALGLEFNTVMIQGRPQLLDRLVEELYGLRPVEMSRFAPLVFAATDDPVAHDIIDAAIDELVALLGTVVDSDAAGQKADPVVLGGSVLRNGILGEGRAGVAATFSERLAQHAPHAQVITVADGLQGACVLALRHAGIPVGPELFASLQRQLAGRVPPP